jgi:U3 small nucleolar RNA-associated protein 5
MQKKKKNLTPAPETPLVLAQFDAPRHRLAVVSKDNRLKIWDATSGKLVANCVDPKHLSAAYSCLTWTRPPVRRSAADSSSHQTGGKKRGRPSEKEESRGPDCIALGTEQGTIVVWDLSTFQLLPQFAAAGSAGSTTHHTSATRHNGRVTDAAFNASVSALFTCGVDGAVRQWDFQTGALLDQFKAEKSGIPIEKLALSPDDSTLLTAGSVIKQWDLASKKMIRKFPGHASQVRQLRFVELASELLFLSAAVGDRFINVWSTAPARDPHTPLRVLVHESSVAAVEAVVISAEAAATPAASKSRKKNSAPAPAAASIFLSALAENGTALGLWQLPLSSLAEPAPSAALPPACLITAAAVPSGLAPEASTVILGATFVPGSRSRLLVARGTPVLPSFENIEYAVPSAGNEQVLELPQSIILSAPTAKPLPQPTSSTSKTPAQASGTVVSQLQFPPVPTVSSAMVGRLARSADADAPASDAALVRQLLARATPEEQAAQTALKLRAQSVHTVLAQAIRSNDTALLEECLRLRDAAVIENTVLRLPPAVVLPFLRIVVTKFHATPARGLTLAVWIRSVLEQHLAYLLTLPDLVSQLTGLYQLIDSRVGIYKKVLRVSGRLDLVLSQINKRERLLNAQAGAPTIRAKFSLDDDDADAVDDDEEDNEHDDDDDDDFDSDASDGSASDDPAGDHEGISDDDDFAGSNGSEDESGQSASDSEDD